MTLPERKTLPHGLPVGIRPDEAVFFLTICCEPRGKNQLCTPHIAPALLDAVAFYHQQGKWWMFFALLMPDHLHALTSFPNDNVMPQVVAAWKKYTAREFGIRWQRGFFDHRLRHDESLRSREDYICHNPVRAGLVARAEDWPYVWRPQSPKTVIGCR